MFASPYTEAVLLIVIGVAGGLICLLLGFPVPAGICALVAFAGVGEIRSTSLHLQDMEKFRSK